jgi:hypothetical protein
VLVEDHPNRQVSETVLADFQEDPLSRSKRRQASESSVEAPVAEDKIQCQFNQAPDLPQAIPDSGIACTATSDRSTADHTSKKKDLL